MSCLKVNNIYILNKNTRIYRKHRSACIRYTPMSIYIKQLSFMQDRIYRICFCIFPFYIFLDGVHLNARGTLLYWKNMRYEVRKYGLK